MANWTTNTVVITGKKRTLDFIQKRVETEETKFSFDTIVHMPPELNIEDGSKTDEALLVYLTDKLTVRPDKAAKETDLLQGRIYRWVSNRFSEDWPAELYTRIAGNPAKDPDALYDLGRRYVSNLTCYGYPTWYGWRNSYWGTKWDAADAERMRSDESLTYTFLTANGTPCPVIEALSEKYPSVRIVHTYVYEDDDDMEFSDVYQGGVMIW